jgi:predicted MPP superfamily phosphohydrolase
MYDLIGDIHGHADELMQLLEALGYEKSQGVYRHTERKVIFLGDFIDRGPKIRHVLETVRPMIEEGTALAVMGNHELNALAFHTDPNHTEAFLRKRNNKNIRQHGQTILQLSDKDLEKALDWFRTLPMWLDLDGLRVVHACWDEKEINKIEEKGRKRKPY